MNKPYFKPLMTYLTSHEAIASLPLIYQEQQIAAFVKEYAPSIKLFLYPYFDEEEGSFLNFVREEVNERILPTLTPAFVEGVLAVFAESFTIDTKPSEIELRRLLQHLLEIPACRKQLFLNFTLLQSELPRQLVNGLFSFKNPYTIHLIESEEGRTFTAKMINDLVCALLFLSPIALLWSEDNGNLLKANHLHKAVQDLKRRFVFLPLTLLQKSLEVQIPLNEFASTGSLSRLSAIFQEKARFPSLYDELSGSLSVEESWFANEFNNPRLDKRILKELWESYQEWIL